MPIWQNGNETQYNCDKKQMRHNAIVTNYKCDKMKSGQNKNET